MADYQTDVLIIGGGVAGLWLHNRLNQQGCHATLIENNTLGGKQTFAAQGIIHGGSKYALNGLLSSAAAAIGGMPDRWRACLTGTGEINLQDTTIFTDHQLLWSKQQLASKMVSFFASKAVRGKMQALTSAAYPDLFKHPKFKGTLYQLNEPVIDVPSLVANLVHPWAHRIMQTTAEMPLNWQSESTAKIGNDTISAQHVVLTAGEGTQALLDDMGISQPTMQRRPLQMVLCKSQDPKHPLPPLYAHSLGAGAKPLATLTSHYNQAGETVWYIGGDIAETGVSRSKTDQISQAAHLLKDILPWVELPALDWATHHVTRAEPAQSAGNRPDTAFVASVGKRHICWPTKLALAPDLTDRMLTALTAAGLTANNHTDIPSPHPIKIAAPLWDTAFT